MFDRINISTPALLAAVMVLHVAAGPTLAPAQTQYEAIELPPSDGAFQDCYGRSVSLSGDVALIGADYDDDAGADAGSTYVYRFDGAGWVCETKLTASDAAPGDQFGRSVGVDGNLAVVGAFKADDPVDEAGSAYVFRHNGTTWIEEAEFTGANAIDWFGYSVAVSGNVLVIGAVGAGDDGTVYVFRHDGTTWVQEGQLSGSGSLPPSNWCGCAVAVDGDVLVFGNEAYNGGTCMGAAYIFRYDGVSWNEEAALVNPDAETSEWFGHSVSVRGDVVVVGAYRDGDLGLNSGSASVYRYVGGGSWVHEAKLTASDGGAEERFGESVGVQGDVVVIGATGAHSDVNSFTGKAYLFRREAANWVERSKLAASDGLPHELFGNSLSISGKRTLIGAHGANGAGAWSGSAYVFEFCLGDLNGDDAVNLSDLAGLLSNYGMTSGATYYNGDLDGDGDVDLPDLAALLAVYGTACP